MLEPIFPLAHCAMVCEMISRLLDGDWSRTQRIALSSFGWNGEVQSTPAEKRLNGWELVSGAEAMNFHEQKKTDSQASQGQGRNDGYSLELAHEHLQIKWIMWELSGLDGRAVTRKITNWRGAYESDAKNRSQKDDRIY